MSLKPNLYSHLTFPSYVYHPYPKWIDMPDGTRRIVEDEKEHNAVLAEFAGPETEAEPQPVKRPVGRPPNAKAADAA